MLVGNQGQHMVLGRMYTDDQLFRIIVSKQFTLHAYFPGTQIKAGFSENFITTSGDIRPDFTNEDIVLVLQYRWPEECRGLKASDIDAVNDSIKGIGNSLNSEAASPSYHDVALSDYCRERLYNNKVRREQILDSFKAELQEARRVQAAAVEQCCKLIEPEVLQYIIIEKVHRASSWDSIATSLNGTYKRPAWFTGHFSSFDAGLVERIFQRLAGAGIIKPEDVRRESVKLSLTVPTWKATRKAQSQMFSPITPAAMTLAESQGDDSTSQP